MLNLLKLIQLFLWKHDTKGLEYNIGDADCLCSGISALVLKFIFYRMAVVFHKQYSPFPWITLQSFCTKLSFPYAASLCFVKTIVETHLSKQGSLSAYVSSCRYMPLLLCSTNNFPPIYLPALVRGASESNTLAFSKITSYIWGN